MQQEQGTVPEDNFTIHHVLRPQQIFFPLALYLKLEKILHQPSKCQLHLPFFTNNSVQDSALCEVVCVRLQA